MNQDNFYFKRLQMVETQIKSRGITDQQLLNAMQIVPRHLFVPESIKNYAYVDDPLSIGYGQTISQPYIVAFMTEALHLNKESKILEIGTGSGYQAAILSKICKEIYTIEIIKDLAIRSKELLQQLGYNNIHVKIGDGNEGWPEQAPFDAIMITAASDHIPNILLNQLKIGGRIIMPLKEDDTNQTLVLLTKIDDQNNFKQEKILPVRFVPLTGKTNLH